MGDFKFEDGVEYVKIYGLQRSGTNFLSHLINKNFENTKSLVNMGGWKHGYYHSAEALGRECHVLAVVKNPYSWLVSMYRYWGPDKQKQIGMDLEGVTFSEFVRNRAIFERQKGVPYLFRAANPVQHWNDMNFHWLSIKLKEKKLSVVTYEAALMAPEWTLNTIAHTLGLTVVESSKAEFVTKCEKICLPGGEETKLSEQDWTGREFYENQEYLKEFDGPLLDFVNSQLDLDLMTHFGYQFEEKV